MSTPTIIALLVVCVLLGVTIHYARRLLKALNLYNEARVEMPKLLNQFNLSITNAQATLYSYKEAISEADTMFPVHHTPNGDRPRSLTPHIRRNNSIVSRAAAIAQDQK